MEENREKLNRLLLKMSENIDISDTRYEQAKSRYESIGKWLNREDSLVKLYKPEVYPQGSLSYGTIIKPISGDEDYDVDIVCVLSIGKDKITQSQLKEIVGKEIILYADENGMKNVAEEGRRCWTLNYSDGAQFHVDTLAAIPNGLSFEAFLESNGIQNSFAKYAIAITDTKDENYEIITTQWPCSNPKGYCEWFRGRMKTEFDSRREKLLLEGTYDRIEDIPEYRVKTPLQRVIQLLKRHRDIMFMSDDSGDKPISIIITTLAAKAYENETSIVDAYINIVNNMEKFIEKEGDVYYIKNPVNPLENFADKWTNKPKRKENFFLWLSKVKKDINNCINEELGDIVKQYKNIYGEKTVNESVDNIEEDENRKVSLLSIINGLEVSHKKNIKWPIMYYGNVLFKAYYMNNGGMYKNQFKSNEKIRKQCKLKFVARTNVEKPYDVYWQITNTGDESRKAHCLRGDFYNGEISEGKLVRREESLYMGKHLVECFIVKNGYCVARSGEFIVNITI